MFEVDSFSAFLRQACGLPGSHDAAGREAGCASPGHQLHEEVKKTLFSRSSWFVYGWRFVVFVCLLCVVTCTTRFSTWLVLLSVLWAGMCVCVCV